MDDEINGIAWKIGWNSYPVVVISTLVVGLMGGEANGASLAVVGFVAGVAASVWGMIEINGNYEGLVETFLAETKRRVTENAGLQDTDTVLFSYSQGDGPVGVNAPRRVYASVLVVGAEAIHITKGVEYALESRSITNGGVEKEYYYDQIASVDSQKVGQQKMLQLSTTDGENIQVQSGQTKIESEVSAIKERMREQKAKRV